MTRVKIFLAFIGITSMLHAQQPSTNLIPESFKSHPEYGKLKFGKDQSSIELIQHRTENARTFVDGKGQYHTMQTGGYFHFKNERGEWISIQETISENGGKAGIFQTEMPMSVDLRTGRSEMTLEKKGRSIVFGAHASLRYLDAAGQALRSQDANSQIQSHMADEHELVLKDIFPGIDRVQTMEYWSLRTDYSINSRMNIPAAARYAEFADQMHLPAGWKLEYDEGEMAADGWQGTLRILNEEGFIVSTISKPLYFDAFESPSREAMNGHYGMGFYRIEKQGNVFTLKLLVPTEWLNSEALVYPLTIDPTATNTYANLQALEDKNTTYSSACQATMAVTIPAGTYQVTGTTTTWRIWAKGFIYSNNYADKTEQRSRVGAHLTGTSWTATQSGTGTNHSGSGYNYTSSNNGQAYTLNNQNIANGCYNTSTINYIWQGYQTFFPHASSAPQAGRVSGCVTNYQELVANTWVVTTTYNVLTMSMTATPTAQTICSGQATSIALSSTTSNTTYAWTVAQSGTAGGANGSGPNIAQTLTVPGTTAGTATYTITPTYGTCPGTPVNVVITVNPGPVVSAGPDITICSGQQVTLSGSGADTYTWNNGVTNGVPFTPSGPGTYTVTGTQNGCTGTDQMVISMGSLTTLDAGPNQSVCAGQSVTLTATGATTYSWNNGVTNGVPFTPTTTTTYTVTGQDAGGCTATDQVTVTVNATPAANAGPDQTICAGQSVTLTASGISNPVWTNGVVDGQSFTPTATTTYTVNGTSAGGCPGTDDVTITVTPLPAVSAGNDITICAGAQATLTGSGATTYTWNNNVSNGVPFTPAATTTYTVTGTTGTCSATDQVVVTVIPTPVVSFVPNVTSGCLPLTVTYTSSGASNSCQWIFGDGSTGTGCGTATHTYTAAGCFDVTLITTTPEGCVGQQQLIDVVCTAPDPVASFTVNPGTLTAMSSFAQMNNTSQGAASYIWTFGDGSPVSTLTNPGHLFPGAPGTYQITLIALSDYGCRDTARVSIEVEDELIYYVPNAFTPDDDQHNPEFKPVFTAGFDPYDYTLLIFNRWGEIIFESHNAAYGWPGTYGEGGARAMDGTYVWRIEFKTTRSDERKLLMGSVTLIR